MRVLKALPPAKRTAFIKKAKEDKRLQGKWRLKSTAQRFFGVALSSSFVTQLDYFPEEEKVQVLLSGRPYTYKNVPELIFVAWTKGAATCSTSDSRKRKRWWIGKTPSLGAFFNDKIKNRSGITEFKGWV